MTSKIEMEIEMETVTIELPKQIMNLLRLSEKITGDSPKEDIESNFLDTIRARIDAGTFLPTREQLIDEFNLIQIFKE